MVCATLVFLWRRRRRTPTTPAPHDHNQLELSTEADKPDFDGGPGELEGAAFDRDRKQSDNTFPVNSHLESPAVISGEYSTLSVDKTSHEPPGSVVSMASTSPQVYEPYRPPEKCYVQLIRNEQGAQTVDAGRSENMVSSK